MSPSDYLSLQQWLSPAFPVGGFVWSHGLETAVSDGDVHDAASLTSWLETLITRGSGAADATLVAASLAPEADHAALSGLAMALAGSAERAAETEAQGHAFTEAHNAMTGKEFPACAMPVAVGRAAACLDIPPAIVVAAYLQAFVSNLVSAAVRFIPLGATAGQAVLAALQPLIVEAAQEALARTPDDIALSQPGADIASIRHETQAIRIFRS